MAIHTQSLLLASVGMYEIIIAFPIAFFFYKIVFGVKYFQTLQILSVFVMLGIGADDVFVFVDAFKQASTQVRVDVCVYERRQENHTCAYSLSAFLRAKNPGFDQR